MGRTYKLIPLSLASKNFASAEFTYLFPIWLTKTCGHPSTSRGSAGNVGLDDVNAGTRGVRPGRYLTGPIRGGCRWAGDGVNCGPDGAGVFLSLGSSAPVRLSPGLLLCSSGRGMGWNMPPGAHRSHRKGPLSSRDGYRQGAGFDGGREQRQHTHSEQRQDEERRKRAGVDARLARPSRHGAQALTTIHQGGATGGGVLVQGGAVSAGAGV